MRDEHDSECFPKRQSTSAFTLVEMLVSSAVLIIILAIVFTIITEIGQIWKSSNNRIQTFQEARAGFEAMTRRVGQATLNTYYDYYQKVGSNYSIRTTANSATFVPNTYDRVSELHFISGQAKTLLGGSPTTVTTQTHGLFFQAPLGYSVTYPRLDNSLNASGFYLKFDDGASFVPDYIKTAPSYKARYRYRLMEMLQPTETLGVYFGNPNDWFANNAVSNSRVLAENVIAMIILPKLPPSQDTSTNGTAMAPTYNYNSRIGLGQTSDSSWTTASPTFPGDQFSATTASGTTLNLTRHNQLPPVLHVIMVVIDEPSALKLQGTATTVPKAIDFATLTPTLFSDATKLTADLQAVEDICNAKSGNLTDNTMRLNYRIFDSDVIIRDSQWSNN